MLLLPKLIERVFVLLELNIPVVKSLPFKFSTPNVNVVVAVARAKDSAPTSVVVPPSVLLIFRDAIDLPLLVILPAPDVTTDKLVNVPPADKTKLSMFTDVAGIANAVVPKSNVLNQLPVVIVAIPVPLPVRVKFGLLVAEPPVVPNTYVLVIDASAVNPPVPVYVNPVAVAIDNTVVAAVVCANTILPLPKLIERVLVLLELNIPVVSVNPANAKVPDVNVVVAVAVANDNALPKVVVPEVLLIVNAAIVLPLGVIVPVPIIIAVNVVNVPPLLRVNPFKFSEVVPGLNAVVPKFKVSK